jgi:hypothetical protein
MVRRGLSIIGVAAASAILIAGLGSPTVKDDRPQDTGDAAIAIDVPQKAEAILRENCFECHGEKRKRGSLRLDSRAAAVRGGVSGPAIASHNSNESLLIRRVRGLGDQKRMPLDGEPLTPEQIEVLGAWIDGGAKWPDGAERLSEQTEQKHWSYVAPVRPALPQVSDESWVRNPIDRFVLTRLDREGMKPSPPADRSTLLRRVFLDLIGLPPTIEQANRFLSDARPDAYERLVDELLVSPHYGERWARPWLDLARYADSNGYEKDRLRTIWPYRDWVIRALNDDMPFDQFTIEQLAGDLLPEATIEQRIATGFHRNSMINEEGGSDPEEYRCHVAADRVNTTATVWLGSTIACAQCHNHKFDPFTQKEYYQLFAFFNNTPDEVRRTETNDILENSVKLTIPLPDEAAVRERIDELEAALDAETAELESAQNAWEQEVTRGAAWSELPLITAESHGGAALTPQVDGSLLAEGERPDKDAYALIVECPLSQITAFRLETLTTGGTDTPGPGRTPHGNFVLSEIRVNLIPAADSSPDGTPGDRAVAWHSAAADHSQPDFAVTAAIDGNVRTGWAIAGEFGKPHSAVFVPTHPLENTRGAIFHIVLDQQYGGKHTIGRFRIMATDDRGDVSRYLLPQPIREIVAIPRAARSGEQRSEVRRYYRSVTPLLLAQRDELASLRRRLDGRVNTLVMQELPQPRETFVHTRGDFLQRGEQVEPSVPRVLAPTRLNPTAARPNRLDLARWLVHRENPLTARVTMNRVWEQYFGCGLVATSEDFGVQGEPPSHPELLDWLATEFTEPGPSLDGSSVPAADAWRLKRLHRLIVLSATYRQSSVVTPELLARDPHNRLLARGARFRLEAELLRDQALAASGLLSRKIGGPSVMPYQVDGVWNGSRNAYNWTTSGGDDRYRRGIYTFWRRSTPYPSFVSFDAPNREVTCTRRPRTNTPLQALTTLNDPEFVTPAAALARRMLREGGAAPESRAAFGFRAVLARAPRSDESDRLVALYQQQLDHFRKDGVAAETLAATGSSDAVPSSNTAELAAWTVVANVLLNLDETLTRG